MVRRLLVCLEEASARFITLSDIKDNQIDEHMVAIFAHPKYQFPENMRRRAEALYRKWEADSQAATEGAAEEEDEEEQLMQITVATGTSSEGVDLLPPSSHDIWGKDGIMHGVM